MIASLFSVRRILRQSALVALSSAVVLAVLPMSAVRAADAPPANAPAAKALPVTTSISKKKGEEGSSFVLKVKNTSEEALSVSAQVLLSVAFHATNKARNLPAHTIKPGKTWRIKELSAQDKVILTADGYASLEVTVE